MKTTARVAIATLAVVFMAHTCYGGIVGDVTGHSVPRGPLTLPDNVARIAATNPGNSEGIFNRLVKFLDVRHGHVFPETLITIRHSPGEIPTEKTIIKPYVRDAFKIMLDGVEISGFTIRDTMFDTHYASEYDALMTKVNEIIRRSNAGRLPKYHFKELPGFVGLPHRDAFQLIPHWRTNYAGGLLKDVTIRGNRVISQGKLQGIFASDGAFENLRILGNYVHTTSAHQITIAGMLSGEISGNWGSGEISVKLLPMRIGGGNNVFVLSFHPSSSYQYRTVSGIAHGVDRRGEVHKEKKVGARYMRDFRMDQFLAEYNRVTGHQQLSGIERARVAAQIAVRYGRIVSE